MKSTYRVLFIIRKSKVNKDGLATVSARITIDGQSVEFSPKLSANASLWNPIGKMNGKTKEVRDVNDALDKVKADLKKQINPEDELVPLDIISDQNTIHDQGVTIDEFEMLANILQGKITRNTESQVKEVLQKMKGTNLLEQFTNQVKGAEGIANKILGCFDNNEKNLNNTGFDFSKYIRK